MTNRANGRGYRVLQDIEMPDELVRSMVVW